MPQQLAGFPYWEVEFDEDGELADPQAVQKFIAEAAGSVTDLFMFSHGWNNDQATARDLYSRFFKQMRDVLHARQTAAAQIGVVGILWPSIRWADEPVAGAIGGAASIRSAPSDEQLVQDLKKVFKTKRERQAIDGMARLLRDKPKKEQALKKFHQLMKTLAGKSASAVPEDNGEKAGLLAEDPLRVFKRFAALAPRRRRGGSAGVGDLFDSLWDGAKEALRATTYWQMKIRAGTVGKGGLGPLIGRLRAAAPALKLHLIGHSFGARLVSFALAGLPNTGKSAVKTLFLLQGAFSHFAFADQLPQDPQRGGGLKGMARRVDGPLCVTHSLKDTAVGTAYPLASIASRDDAAAVSDAFYRWGAMGHDGAQAVSASTATLGAVGVDYPFRAGAFTNLDGNSVITRGGPPSGAHSDIVHPEIAWAVLSAAGLAS